MSEVAAAVLHQLREIQDRRWVLERRQQELILAELEAQAGIEEVKRELEEIEPKEEELQGWLLEGTPRDVE